VLGYVAVMPVCLDDVANEQWDPAPAVNRRIPSPFGFRFHGADRNTELRDNFGIT